MTKTILLSILASVIYAYGVVSISNNKWVSAFIRRIIRWARSLK